MSWLAPHPPCLLGPISSQRLPAVWHVIGMRLEWYEFVCGELVSCMVIGIILTADERR
jgi:hypothetical protein